MGLDNGTYTIRNRLHDTDLNTKDCSADHPTVTSNVFIYKVASKSATDTSGSSTSWTVATSDGTTAQTISTSITPSGGTATTYTTYECTEHNKAEAYTDKSTGWTITPVIEKTVQTTKTVTTVTVGTTVVDTKTTESTTTTSKTFYTIGTGDKRWKLSSKTDGIVNIEVPPTDKTGSSHHAFHFTFNKVS